MVKEAAAVIEKRTGLRRSLSQVRQFMQGWGLRRREVGSVPAKVDLVEREAFKIQKLEPRLKEAQAGQHTVFFIDAAHFVFAPFLGFLWFFTRLFVKASCGRLRFNVLGALIPIIQELVMVTNGTYINATSVCALLQQLASRVQRPTPRSWIMAAIKNASLSESWLSVWVLSCSICPPTRLI